MSFGSRMGVTCQGFRLNVLVQCGLSRCGLSKPPHCEIHYATMADMCGSLRHKTHGPVVGPSAASLLVFLEQLVPGNLLFRHFGKLDQEVNDLVLEQGCAQGAERTRILLVVLPNLPLLAGELPHLLH